MGKAAVSLGLISPETLAECQAEQQRAWTTGEPVPLLAQILLRRRVLSTTEMARLLQEISPETRLAPDQSPCLGKYHLVGELGRGGGGVVYQAIDPDLQRPVALKVLPVDSSPTMVARFLREARLAARLTHPSIIRIHEVGQTDDPASGRPLFYIAMDFVAGDNLQQALGRLSLDERLKILEQVADAIGVAHAAGVIHRDLKPANILLAPGNRPVVADFGTSREEQDLTELTRSGALLGTPTYMAPEQVLGQVRKVGPTTDVWALGVLLYRMLTDQLPFDGQTQAALFEQILAADPMPVRRRNPRIARKLELICLEALRKEQRERYPSAAELGQDLRRYRQGKTLLVQSKSTLSRVQPWLRRKARVGTVLVLALTLLLTLGWWGVSRHRRTARQQQYRKRAQAALAREAKERDDRQRLRQGQGFRERKSLLDGIRHKIAETRALFYISQVNIREKLRLLERELLGLERALRADPASDQSAEAWSLLGMGWYFVGKDAVAERCLRHALKTRPKDGWSHFYLGRIYLDRAMFESVSQWRGAPTRAQGWNDLALVQLNQTRGSWAEVPEVDRQLSRACSLRAAGKLDQLARICREGLERFRGQLGAEGFWLLQWTRGEQQTLDKALKIRPHYPLAYLARGLERGWKNDPAGAIRDFDAALQTNPYQVNAYNGRGAARAKLGDRTGALADFEKAIEINPKHPFAYNNRGLSRTRWGKLDLALADFDRAIKLEPRYAAAHFNRAITRTLRGDRSGALRDYTQAIRLDPRQAGYYLNRGNLRVEQGKLAVAIADFNQAIRLDRRQSDAYNGRGNARLRQNNAAGAIADYTAALQLAPRRAEFWANRGLARSVLNDLRGAIADLRKSTVLAPRRWQSWFGLGVMLSGLGQQTEALTAVLEARRLAPPRNRAQIESWIARIRQKQ